MGKQEKTKLDKPLKQSRFYSWYPYVLVVGGTIGMLAAIKLTMDKIDLLANPGKELACDLNPVIGCGNVIETDQASAFGSLPNPFFGIAGFAIVVTIGMGMIAGAKYKKWFWLGLQTGVTLGVIFVHWLIYQSLFNIGALCPYCMAVWIATIPIFYYTTWYNVKEGNIRISKKYKKYVDFKWRHQAEILLIWFLIIIGLILYKFWYYWETLI